ITCLQFAETKHFQFIFEPAFFCKNPGCSYGSEIPELLAGPKPGRAIAAGIQVNNIFICPIVIDPSENGGIKVFSRTLSYGQGRSARERSQHIIAGIPGAGDKYPICIGLLIRATCQYV